MQRLADMAADIARTASYQNRWLFRHGSPLALLNRDPRHAPAAILHDTGRTILFRLRVALSLGRALCGFVAMLAADAPDVCSLHAMEATEASTGSAEASAIMRDDVKRANNSARRVLRGGTGASKKQWSRMHPGTFAFKETWCPHETNRRPR